ncbi:MAG: hypothetical protein AAF725_13355 [Acidobacteriota bacterium]
MAERRAELLDRISGLIESGQGLKVVVPQDTGFFSLDPALVPNILAMLRETAQTLHDVTERFETAPPERGSSTLKPQEVADLAFVCRSELVELESSLSQVSKANNLWQTAAEADRAVARALRAMIPIEGLLREYSGLEPVPRRWFDLDDALTIRRRFIDLWLITRRRSKSEPPSGDGLRAAFESLAGRIAALRKDAIYPYLRIDDRLQIRALQKRILAQLEKGVDPEEGPRLWQDASGFFDLLMHIHRREELREHDRLVAGRVYRRIYDLVNVPERLPEEDHLKLMDLASIEPSLDELLLRDSPARSADYRQPLEALRARLG